METTDNIIDELATDLEPVRRPPAPARTALLWVLCSAAFVGVVMALIQPFREGWLTQAAASPRFTLELVLGLATAAAAAPAAFALGLPGPVLAGRRALPAASLATAFGLLLAWALFDSPLASSMAGKRPFCAIEIWVFAIPPLAVAAAVLKRRYFVLDRRATAGSLALGASFLPLAWMQAACMYDPVHSLALHLLPALLFVPAAAWAVVRYWQR